MKEGELLKKDRERLREELDVLLGEKEVNGLMVQEKVVQVKQQKELIKDVSQCIVIALFRVVLLKTKNKHQM